MNQAQKAIIQFCATIAKFYTGGPMKVTGIQKDKKGILSRRNCLRLRAIAQQNWSKKGSKREVAVISLPELRL